MEKLNLEIDLDGYKTTITTDGEYLIGLQQYYMSLYQYRVSKYAVCHAFAPKSYDPWKHTTSYIISMFNEEFNASSFYRHIVFDIYSLVNDAVKAVRTENPHSSNLVHVPYPFKAITVGLFEDNKSVQLGNLKFVTYMMNNNTGLKIINDTIDQIDAQTLYDILSKRRTISKFATKLIGRIMKKMYGKTELFELLLG